MEDWEWEWKRGMLSPQHMISNIHIRGITRCISCHNWFSEFRIIAQDTLLPKGFEGYPGKAWCTANQSRRPNNRSSSHKLSYNMASSMAKLIMGSSTIHSNIEAYSIPNRRATSTKPPVLMSTQISTNPPSLACATLSTDHASSSSRST